MYNIQIYAEHPDTPSSSECTHPPNAPGRQTMCSIRGSQLEVHYNRPAHNPQQSVFPCRDMKPHVIYSSVATQHSEPLTVSYLVQSILHSPSVCQIHHETIYLKMYKRKLKFKLKIRRAYQCTEKNVTSMPGSRICHQAPLTSAKWHLYSHIWMLTKIKHTCKYNTHFLFLNTGILHLFLKQSTRYKIHHFNDGFVWGAFGPSMKSIWWSLLSFEIDAVVSVIWRTHLAWKCLLMPQTLGFCSI